MCYTQEHTKDKLLQLLSCTTHTCTSGALHSCCGTIHLCSSMIRKSGSLTIMNVCRRNTAIATMSGGVMFCFIELAQKATVIADTALVLLRYWLVAQTTNKVTTIQAVEHGPVKSLEDVSIEQRNMTKDYSIAWVIWR
uniref:Uncharacterized protein C2orf78 n=1 Tax=Lygus hesperus TaxID=30085 RepID=A0A0A9Y194_LYGHE